jgi:hypothetical protein
MSEPKTPSQLSKDPAGGRREGVPVKPAATGARNADRIRGRHAAITNNFNKWRSYQDWAEKIRGTLDEKNK